jgi:hypothetical protein
LTPNELSILIDPLNMSGLEIGAAVFGLVVGTIDIIHKFIEIYDAVKDKSGNNIGQAHSTSPLALARRRVLECLSFRLNLERLLVRASTYSYILLSAI